MNWRRIDNMLVTWCIEHIQKEIDGGNLVPPPITTAAQFNAWKTHMLHRMMDESANNKWIDESRTTYDPMNELEEDELYYESLQEKRKEV
jgi:trans-aconitate methyltransferase